MARVLTAHGVRGELKCQLVTDFPERFRRGTRLFVAQPQQPGRWLTVRSARPLGAQLLLRCQEIDDRDQAEALRGAELRVAAADAVPLPEGQFFWHQVIGLRVEDTSGQLLGTLQEILPTGANDVYIVRGGPRGELLIPAIKDVVKELDPAAGRVVVEPLPGLLPEPAAPRRPRRNRARRPG